MEGENMFLGEESVFKACGALEVYLDVIPVLLPFRQTLRKC